MSRVEIPKLISTMGHPNNNMVISGKFTILYQRMKLMGLISWMVGGNPSIT
jgi:hypothetical protein